MAGIIPKPVVLYCTGCFNPVTNKHLRLMELARDALHKTGKYRVLKGIFSPAHDKYGKEGLLPAAQRYEMMKLAVKSNPWLCVDTWEIEQSDWTPTHIVLTNLKERLAAGAVNLMGSDSNPSEDGPQRKRTRRSQDNLVVPKDTLIKLVCGGDLLESFAVPGLWAEDHMESIARDFGLAVIVRENSDPHRYIYENEMLYKYTHNIDIVFDRVGDDLSSTKIRIALKRNESIKYLVQDSVLDYIINNKLYNPNYNPDNLFPSTSS